MLAALWLTIVATALSYVFFSRGLGATTVAVAATLILAEPVTAGILGIVVLDEPVRLSTLLGMALVALGLVVLSLGGRIQPEPI